MGGSDQSVGAAGGWAQVSSRCMFCYRSPLNPSKGGGHSPLTPNYGMGADRTVRSSISSVSGVVADDRDTAAIQDRNSRRGVPHG